MQLPPQRADSVAMRLRATAFYVLATLLSIPACVGTDSDPMASSPEPVDGTDAGPTAPPSVDGVSDDELTEDFGIFVAAPGARDGDGSRVKPFGTIGAHRLLHVPVLAMQRLVSRAAAQA